MFKTPSIEIFHTANEQEIMETIYLNNAKLILINRYIYNLSLKYFNIS